MGAKVTGGVFFIYTYVNFVLVKHFLFALFFSRTGFSLCLHQLEQLRILPLIFLLSFEPSSFTVSLPVHLCSEYATFKRPSGRTEDSL